MTVSGIVADRSMTVYGYRLILDHLTFLPQGTNPLQVQIAESLNQAVSGQDRIQVFLSDGSGGNAQMYGNEKQEAGLWPDSGDEEDQSDLFRSVRIGDRISLHGKCTLPEQATNPGQFDSRQYALARRIVLKMSEVKEEETDDSMRKNLLWNLRYGYRNFLADLRIGMQKGLNLVFGREDAAQVAAFLLGEGSGMDAGTKQLFRDGGLSWLVCVSSLPVSLLGMMAYSFLRKRGISFASASVSACAVAGSYAVMTGFSLSAQRALCTFAFWLGAQIPGRTRDTLNALSAAVLFILIRQPAAIRDSSFLLSCTSILSLEYLTPAVSRIFRPQMSWQKKLCGSFGLYLGSLPAVLWFFYQTTPLTFLLYPVTLSLMGLTLCFGIFGSLGGYLYLMTGIPAVSAAGRTLAWPCRIMLGAFRYVCMAQRKLPFSVLILGRPRLWQVLVYYGALVLIVILTVQMDGKKRLVIGIRHSPAGKSAWIMGRMKKNRLAAAFLFGGLIWILSLRWKPEFRYTCLDIGQGSCNLIEHDGCAYLFDAGSSSVENVWRYRIDSTLKYYGIRKLDMVLISHGDMDHLNGIGQMLACYEKDLTGRNAGDVTIGRILLPDLPSPDERLKALIQEADEKGIEIGSVMEGTALTQRDMNLEILAPSPDRITGNANEDCIVMLLSFRDLRILFAGDLEKEGESMFVNHYQKSRLFQTDQKSSSFCTDQEHLLLCTDQKEPFLCTDQKEPLLCTDQEEPLLCTDQKEPLLCTEQKDSLLQPDPGTMILVAGHHGSKNATSQELLEMVKPDLVLISCGKNNRYGHPSVEMLERVKEAGAACRRTDLEGAVTVTC